MKEHFIFYFNEQQLKGNDNYPYKEKIMQTVFYI